MSFLMAMLPAVPGMVLSFVLLYICVKLSQEIERLERKLGERA